MGIGTTSPESTLEISKNDQTNGATLSITNAFNGGSWSSGDTVGKIDFRSDDTSATEPVRARIKVFDDLSGGSNTYPYATALSISTTLNNTATERMRIDSSGNVGIGTSSPSNTLDVAGTLRYDGRLLTDSTTSDGSASAPSIVVGYDYDNGFFRPASNSIGITTGGSERMRIDSSGNVLIGTTDTTLYSSTGSTSGLLFDPNGPSTISRNSSAASLILNKTGTTNFGNILDFRKNGTSVGNVAVGSSTTTYNTSSDYRLKENVVTLTGATERLKQLQPKRFNFIVEPDTVYDGFIAHEVSTVVPEAITGEKDAVDEEGNPVHQGIDQSKLVPLLVATIQELEARIAALEA